MARTDRALVPAKRGYWHRQHLHRPAVKGGMVDSDAVLGRHLFRVTQTQRVSHISTRAHQHQFEWVRQTIDDPAKGFADNLGLDRQHRQIVTARISRQNWATLFTAFALA